MNKSEMIEPLSEYNSREEVVKAAIDDEKIRKLLFSLLEEQANNKSLDIRSCRGRTISEDNRILEESKILLNSMDAISKLGEWDSRLIQPVIPNIISFLDYEYDPINEGASGVIVHAINKENTDLIKRAIPKLLNLLDYHECFIENEKTDNQSSVSNAERALYFISLLSPESLKDTVTILTKYTNATVRDILKNISEQNEFAYYNLALNAVKDNPNNPEALKAFGDVIIKTNNGFEFDFSKKSTWKSYEKGIEYFKKSAEVKPSFEIFYHTGNTYFRLWLQMTGTTESEEFKKDTLQEIIRNSLYYYTKASELNPEDIDCKLNIALRNDQLGNHNESISLLEELHKKAPDNSEVSGRLAEFYVVAAKRLNEEKKYYDAYNFLLKANNIEDIYPGTREDLDPGTREYLDKMLGDADLRSKLRIRLNELKRDNDNLSKEISKKFNESGEKAYSEDKTVLDDLAPEVKAKLDEIQAIDTLINKTVNDTENKKTREKKSGFFAKLVDTFSSAAKQGKLKIDLYNLEKKKKDAFTAFGEALYKNGQSTLIDLSNIWKEITEIEEKFNRNEEEINNLNKILR